MHASPDADAGDDADADADATLVLSSPGFIPTGYFAAGSFSLALTRPPREEHTQQLSGTVRWRPRSPTQRLPILGAAAAAQKSFADRVRALCKAPRDLFIIFSIKFMETSAYFGFSYIYVAFLSDEFGMSDVEAGYIYAL